MVSWYRGRGRGSDLPPVMSLSRSMRETLEPAYVRSLLPSVLASVPAHRPSKSATEAGAASPYRPSVSGCGGASPIAMSSRALLVISGELRSARKTAARGAVGRPTEARLAKSAALEVGTRIASRGNFALSWRRTYSM